MKKKFFLSVFVIFWMILSISSCKKEFNELIPDFSNSSSEIKYSDSPISESELNTLCDSLKSDLDFKKFSSLMFEDSYILKAIEQGKISIENVYNFQNYLKTKLPTDTMSFQEFYTFFGNEADNIHAYFYDMQYYFFKIVRKHFSDLDTTSIKSGFICAFTSNESENNLTSISCCEGCKAAYQMCVKHAEQDGGVVFASGGIIGICTLNPIGIFGGLIGGALAGILTYGNEKNQCRDNYNLCKSGCNGGCK